MSGRPNWTEDEVVAAAELGFDEFTQLYPARTYDAWRIKRQRQGTFLSNLDNNTAVGTVVRPRMAHPHGWEPGVAWDGVTGTLTAGPVERDPKWDDVLRVWDLDPELFEVIEPVQYRAWDANVGKGEVKRMFYYRANIRSRRPMEDRPDVERLIAEVKAHSGIRRKFKPASTAMVVNLADWQLGKRGTEATVKRLADLKDAVGSKIEQRRDEGRPIGVLNVNGMGDIVEACSGFYDMQEFEVELDRRDQLKLTRHVLTDLLTTWSHAVPLQVVAAIGGNHGENRRNGKAYTSFGDNDDVAVFETVAEILGANTAYDNTTFVIPRDQLTITLDMAGHIVGLAHGHQIKAKVEDWWKAQVFGRRPVADADILITAHRHHFAALQTGPRMWFQCPTLDSGSPWFEETAGNPSVAGTLTFTLDSLGWHDVEIL